MYKTKEPTQEEFNSALTTVTDIAKTKYPGILTKVGSIVHELILRPAAYIHSWITGSFDATIQQYSIENLKKSTATDNDIADYVASNYFIERKQGTRAKGIITLTISTPTMAIQNGSIVYIDGYHATISRPVFITPNNQVTVDSETLVVNAIRSGTVYLAQVPVELSDVGDIEIQAGAHVELGFPAFEVISAVLTSGITGGSGVETDAELMERASVSTAFAGIGSYYGIAKQLRDAPISVQSFQVIGSDSMELTANRYNTLNMNPCTGVDTYVKLKAQPETITIDLSITTKAAATNSDATVQGTVIQSVSIKDPVYAAIFSVNRVIVNGNDITNFSVNYNDYPFGYFTRLSSRQATTISFPQTADTAGAVTASVTITYMPDIYLLQRYVDTEANVFMGMHNFIKAAVPVKIGFRCSCSRHADDTVIASIKDIIYRTINSYGVGKAVINFSELSDVIAANIEGNGIALPCIITADIITRSGAIDKIYSDTGILRLYNQANTDHWDPKIYYMFTTMNDIEVINV